MRKLVLCLSFIFVTAVLFGCGNTKADSKETQPAENAQAIIIIDDSEDSPASSTDGANFTEMEQSEANQPVEITDDSDILTEEDIENLEDATSGEENLSETEEATVDYDATIEKYTSDGVFDLNSYMEALGYELINVPDEDIEANYRINISGQEYFVYVVLNAYALVFERDGLCYNCFFDNNHKKFEHAPKISTKYGIREDEMMLDLTENLAFLSREIHFINPAELDIKNLPQLYDLQYSVDVFRDEPTFDEYGRLLTRELENRDYDLGYTKR